MAQGDPSPSDVVSNDEIRAELNFLEDLRNRISGQDEYLEALVTNSRIQAMVALQREQATLGVLPENVQLSESGTPEGYGSIEVSPVPEGNVLSSRYLPLAAVGIANRTIYENDTGPATFDVNGTVQNETVRVTDDARSGDPLRIVAPGNIAEPVENVSLSLLGLTGSIGVNSYERVETEENVTIAPGDDEIVLRVDVNQADWVSAGTVDRPHSTYQYYVDGEELNEEPLYEPLGLYNDPYSFPTPISVDRNLEVEVARESSASGSADYFSKVTYFE